MGQTAGTNCENQAVMNQNLNVDDLLIGSQPSQPPTNPQATEPENQQIETNGIDLVTIDIQTLN